MNSDRKDDTRFIKHQLVDLADEIQFDTLCHLADINNTKLNSQKFFKKEKINKKFRCFFFVLIIKEHVAVTLSIFTLIKK
jgi:hypothetical protein